MVAVSLTSVTRRDVFDYLRTADFAWWGRLDEIAFLRRMYDLDSLPSHDPRFASAEGDIRQHRMNNYDWDDSWVFDDSRFDLASGPDEVVLEFLSQMLHPVVRPDADEAAVIAAAVNSLIKPDGWSLSISGDISGRPIYAPARLGQGSAVTLRFAHAAAARADSAYISRQVTRMEAAIENDPELAIGTAKEFLETICKTILEARGEKYAGKNDLPALARTTITALKLTADDVPDSAPVADTVRRLLMNLATVAQSSAELRNAYGTGHGRAAGNGGGLGPRHARLAVGATVTLGTFLFETHEARIQAS